MIKDYFALAWKNTRRRKLRSWLTIIGIIIATATIFTLISISLGLRNAVEEQFSLLGTDKFFIYSKLEAGMPGESNPIKITTDDVEIISRVSGVKYVTYFIVGNGKIEFNDKSRYYFVMGMPMEDRDAYRIIYESSFMKADEGKLLGKGDTGVAMIGYDYKHANLFGKPVEVGDRIKINDVEFKVQAVIAQIGNPSDDRQVYISAEDFKELFDSGNRADTIFAQVQEGADLEDVADRVEKKLRDFRGQTEKTQDFSVVTPEEYLSTFNDILNIIMVFLISIGAISLFIGAVGIATTMYTAVVERYREIGVMKALGARNSDVLRIFVIESGIIGLIGGAIGVCIGVAISKSIEYIAITQLKTTLLQAAFPAYLIIGCLIFAFIVGIISGTFPAWRASRIKPVQALRYE